MVTYLEGSRNQSAQKGTPVRRKRVNLQNPNKDRDFRGAGGGDDGAS